VATYRSRTTRLVTVAASATLLAVAVLPGVGQAQPRLTLAQVEAQVNALQNQAEAAQEAANAAQLQLAAGQRQLSTLNAQVAKAQAALASAQRSIGAFASAAYRSGGIDQTLQLLFADNPSQFLAQASELNGLSQHESDVMLTVATAEGRLAQAKLAASQEVTHLRQIRDQAAKHESQVRALFRQAENLLNSLQAAQRAQLARQQAAARANQAAQQRALDAQNQVNSQPVSSSPAPYTGNASIGERALQWALRQVGKAYQYAGTGPYAFDCSGLTMMAYRSVGIYLPHYSGWGGQANAGRRIPLNQLLPGDLIIYYPPSLHHVAMYAGNGEIVHAANPSEGVLISPLYSMPIAWAVRPY
jgi:peptidoglycan DL-endopeptidase CwlO